MHITKVVIRNFKSYRSETIVEDLSLGLNVFCGSNGSGKSNFFQAIEFVLKGNKRCVNVNKRLYNLSDGCDGTVSVEIVISSCGPIFGNEVSLKRELSARGNKYAINNKFTNSKNFGDYLEILGLAGISESYFVNRNLINTFLNFSPKQRWNFLVENLGLNTSKTLKTFADVMTKMEKLTLTLSSFQNYLKDFKIFYELKNRNEVKKWKNYKELVAKKDCLLMQLQINYLVRCQKRRTSPLNNNLTINSKEDHKANSISLIKFSTSVEKDKQELMLTQNLLQDAENEKLELIGKSELLDLKIKDLEEKKTTMEQTPLEEDSEEIALLSNRLSKEVEDLEKEKKKLQELKNNQKKVEEKRSLVIEKIGRNNTFPNKQSRDKWLLKEISDLKQKLLNPKKRILSQNKNTLLQISLRQNLLQDLKDAEKASQMEKEAKIEERRLQSELSKLLIEQNEVNRKENILDYDIVNLKKGISDKRTELAIKVGKCTIQGVESVQQVVDQLKKDGNFDGYLGTVVDNFECDDGLNVALDACAGKWLFFHIVRTDYIGTFILKEMKTLNLPGEVQFISLNRINPSDVVQVDDSNALPLINFIQFQDNIEEVIKFCFGGILVCRNLEDAVRLSRSQNCNCVTLEGDVINKSGVLSGGYRASSKPLRLIYKDCLSQQEKLNEKLKHLEQNRQKSNQLSYRTNVISNLQKLNGNLRIQSRQNISDIKNKINESNLEMDRLNSFRKNQEEEISKIENRISTLQLELDQNFTTDHSPDTNKLEHLNKLLIICSENTGKQHLVVLNIERSIDNIESQIKIIKANQSQSKEFGEELNMCKRKLSDYIVKKELIDKRMQLLSSRGITAKSKIENLQRSINKYQAEVNRLEQKIDEYKFSKAKTNLDLNEQIKELEKSIESKKNGFKNLDQMSSRQIHAQVLAIKRSIHELGNVKDMTYATTKETLFKRVDRFTLKTFDEIFMTNVVLMKFNDWFENHIGSIINHTSDIVDSYFNQLVPNSRVSLILEKDDDQLWTTRGLQMSIMTSGDSETCFRPIALSAGQQTALFVSFVFALAQEQSFRIFTLDEVDQFLNNSSITPLIGIISHLRDFQFFASSHKADFIKKGDNLFFVKNITNRSLVSKVDNPYKINNLLMTIAKKESLCSPEDSSMS